ncbi:Esterase/lipase/thioesterase, partial [Trichoderma cornu-damae]
SNRAVKVYNGSPDALRTDEDADGISASTGYIRGLIRDEMGAGVPPERVVLAGFSQGGAGGCCRRLDVSAGSGRHLFLGHGLEDRVVTPGLARRSRDALAAIGFGVSWDVYP